MGKDSTCATSAKIREEGRRNVSKALRVQRPSGESREVQGCLAPAGQRRPDDEASSGDDTEGTVITGRVRMIRMRRPKGSRRSRCHARDSGPRTQVTTASSAIGSLPRRVACPGDGGQGSPAQGTALVSVVASSSSSSSSFRRGGKEESNYGDEDVTRKIRGEVGNSEPIQGGRHRNDLFVEAPARHRPRTGKLARTSWRGRWRGRWGEGNGRLIVC